MSDSESVPPVVNQSIIDELTALLGRDALDQLMADLAQRLGELQDVLRGTAPDPVGLRREAHALISQSGNLGFMQLSAASRGLCDTIRGDVWSDAAAARLADVRDAAERVRVELAGRVPACSSGGPGTS